MVDADLPTVMCLRKAIHDPDFDTKLSFSQFYAFVDNTVKIVSNPGIGLNCTLMPASSTRSNSLRSHDAYMRQ